MACNRRGLNKGNAAPAAAGLSQSWCISTEASAGCNLLQGPGFYALRFPMQSGATTPPSLLPRRGQWQRGQCRFACNAARNRWTSAGPRQLHDTWLPCSLVARRPAPLRRSASGPGASLGSRWVLPGEQLPAAHTPCCLTWLPGSSSLPSVPQRAGQLPALAWQDRCVPALAKLLADTPHPALPAASPCSLTCLTRLR